MKDKPEGQEASQHLGWAGDSWTEEGLPEGSTSTFPSHPAVGKRLLQGDDGHGKVEAQAVLALPHLLLALELTHHIIHVLLLSQKDKAREKRHWQWS